MYRDVDGKLVSVHLGIVSKIHNYGFVKDTDLGKKGEGLLF